VGEDVARRSAGTGTRAMDEALRRARDDKPECEGFGRAPCVLRVEPVSVLRFVRPNQRFTRHHDDGNPERDGRQVAQCATGGVGVKRPPRDRRIGLEHDRFSASHRGKRRTANVPRAHLGALKTRRTRGIRRRLTRCDAGSSRDCVLGRDNRSAEAERDSHNG